MLYTTYGKTNERVSALGMGGMRFEKEIDEKDCVKFIRHANEQGITYFDTAPFYNDDRSEGIYGKALREMKREDYTIATKGPNDMSAEEITNQIEQSIERLGIEYIDFYFLWCIIRPEQFVKAQKEGQSCIL